MTTDTQITFTRPSRGARFGTLFGFTLWAVVLGLHVARAGEPLLGLELGGLGLVMGLGFGQLCLLAVEASDRAGGGPGQRLRVLFGGLFFSMGLMTLVVTEVIRPILAESPEGVLLPRSLGGDLDLPLWLCAGVSALGAVLLSLPRRSKTLKEPL